MDCSAPGLPVHQQLLEFTHAHWSVMPSNHLILCCLLLLLPSILPSIRMFSSESALCISWLGASASASASVLPVNIQDWFPVGLTGLISGQSVKMSTEGVRKSFSQLCHMEAPVHREGHSWVDTLSSLQASSFPASGLELCLLAEVKPVRTYSSEH